jgi:hypothetical protein
MKNVISTIAVIAAIAVLAMSAILVMPAIATVSPAMAESDTSNSQTVSESINISVQDSSNGNDTASVSLEIASNETVDAATGSITFNDQTLSDDGAVTVENMSTGQNSTAVVTYTNGSEEIIAGLASADNLDSENVSVEIEDDGGFPGGHTARVFANSVLPDAGVEAGDDVSGLAGEQLDSESANVTEADTGEAPGPVGGGDTPTNPDGDELYEDVNGDGEANFDDAVALAFASNLSDAQIAAFDFDGDGGVDFDDAVELAFSI